MPAFPIVLNRKPGVFFALTTDGVELPIVDVTHPLFAVSLSEEEQRRLVEEFLAQGQPLAKAPPAVRRLLLRVFLHGSVLAQGIRGSEGTYLSGLGTYLLKLGPAHFSAPIDQKIAAALPSLAVRVRLQDLARLMAEAVKPALRDHATRPLWFVNIAGGPAMDSLNTLLVLQRETPERLRGRSLVVRVLDRDAEGPTFGARAVTELRTPGAPLHGLDVDFQYVPYDWSKVDVLGAVLREARAHQALVVASSEGGLFEYGSNYDIVQNLKAVRAETPDALVAGSVTRADEPIQALRQTSRAATIPRGLEVFRALIVHAGWKVADVVERPLSDQVVLRAG
jgi:hypothetical protein